MKPRLAIASLLACASSHVVQAETPAAPDHTITGRLEIVAGPASEEFGARRLFVWCPKEYDAKQRYAVLYVPDGQDLFDTATAAHGEEWGLDELLSRHPPGITDVIVVGIESAPDSRRDYALPGSMEGARADVFGRYLATRVKPWVDAHYATRPEPAASVVMGEAGAATVALYVAWMHAASFGAAIALELPDLDATSLAWAATPPVGGRPRLWIEQAGGDVAVRPSTTQMMATLRSGAETQYLVGGARATRLSLIVAALRALLGSTH